MASPVQSTTAAGFGVEVPRAGSKQLSRRAFDRWAAGQLGAMGCIYAMAALAQGGAVPAVWLRCQCALGLAALGWALAEGRRSRFQAQSKPVFPAGLLLPPLYAAIQALPLPLAVVALISPARAELQNSIAVLLPDAARWTPLSVHPAATFEFALRLAAYAIVYWLARSAASRLPRHPFAAALPVVLVAALEAILALLQAAAGEQARGTYVNRNHLAGLLEMSLPFAVAAVGPWKSPAGRRGLHRSAMLSLLAAAAAGLILAAVAATRSRAGFAAALASVAVLGSAARRPAARSSRRRLATGLLLAVLAMAFLYLPSENLVRRYGTLVSGDNLRHEGRLRLWRETLDLVAAYPLFGCGFGGYEAAFLRYKRSAPMVADAHAHNDYLELLAEGGVTGFVLCAALAIPLLVRIARACANPNRSGRSLTAACAGSLTAILLHSFVDFNLRIPANGMLLYWVLGIAAAASSAPSNAPRAGESAAESGIKT